MVQNKKQKNIRIVVGLLIVALACLFASLTQNAIDGSGEPSILGFILMWIVGIVFAIGLERILRPLFSDKIIPLTKEEKAKLQLAKDLVRHLEKIGQIEGKATDEEIEARFYKLREERKEQQ